MNYDDYETPAFTVDELRLHDSEYVNPLPRRTNYGVNGFAVQGRRDMLHHYDQLLAERDALLATTAKLREALTELLDARGTSLNIVGHDPVSGHPLSREGMAALKARAALSSTTP